MKKKIISCQKFPFNLSKYVSNILIFISQTTSSIISKNYWKFCIFYILTLLTEEQGGCFFLLSATKFCQTHNNLPFNLQTSTTESI
jgi:hypothetical protein